MEVTITNKNILEKLDSLIDTFYSIYQKEQVSRVHSSPRVPSDKPTEWYMSEECLDLYYKSSDSHDGMPQDWRAVPMSRLLEKDKRFVTLNNEWRYDFTKEIGAHTSALMNFYPEDGLTGWHTNWDANAYQVLLTWSKNGDGYFKYRTNEGEIVTINDTPGWSCRHYYFGRRDEPEHHCWHGCYTKGERFTLAYKFCNDSKKSVNDKLAQEIRDDFLEEIAS